MLTFLLQLWATENVRSNVPSTSSPYSNLAKVTFSLQLSLFLCKSKLSKARKQRFPQGKKKKKISFTLKQLAWAHSALRNFSPVDARGLTWSPCHSLHAYAGLPKLRSHTATSGVLLASKVITVFSTRNLNNIQTIMNCPANKQQKTIIENLQGCLRLNLFWKLKGVSNIY